jgi:hypothetical protein
MSDEKRLSDDQLTALLYVASSVIRGIGVFASRDIEMGEYARMRKPGGSPW